MSSGQRLELVYAETWANVILRKLMRGIDGARACDDGVVGGSVRRRCETVGDIEIILLPVWDAPMQTPMETQLPALVTTNLFGEMAAQQAPEPPARGACTLLDETIDAMIADGIFKRGTPWGQRQRRLIPGPYPEISLELYLADPLNYGNIATIRTGSAEFSKAMMSSWPEGGVLPAGLKQDKGYLWRVDQDDNKLELIPCRTEREYFTVAGVPWVDPTARGNETPGSGEAAVKKLRSYIKATRRAQTEMAA